MRGLHLALLLLGALLVTHGAAAQAITTVPSGCGTANLANTSVPYQTVDTTGRNCGAVSLSAASTGGYSYAHISTDATTVVKTGAGTLHSIMINTGTSGATVTIYDNTAGSGTVIAVASGATQVTLQYDIAFTAGLTVVTAVAAADVTVAYK